MPTYTFPAKQLNSYRKAIKRAGANIKRYYPIDKEGKASVEVDQPIQVPKPAYKEFPFVRQVA